MSDGDKIMKYEYGKAIYDNLNGKGGDLNSEKINAASIATAEESTATANHAVGDLLTMGGKLYVVTDAIASGEAITPGTNVSETDVITQVDAKDADLDKKITTRLVEPWEEFYQTYFATYQMSTTTQITGNKIKWIQVGSNGNPRLIVLSGAYRSIYGKTMQYYDAIAADLIPVSVFDEKINVELYRTFAGNNTRFSRVGYKFYTVDGDTLTAVSYGQLFNESYQAMNSGVIEIPSGATHVAIGIYWASLNDETYTNILKVY